MEKTEKDLGIVGKQGCGVFLDYRGYKSIKKINKGSPDWLKNIIDLRNKSIQSEWDDIVRGKGYFSGENEEEIDKKVKEITKLVSDKMDEMDKKYDEIDKVIDILEDLYKKQK